MHCDKHCVKMILETAQLLSTAHRVLDGDEYADDVGLYKATHKNHPSAVWVRQSWANYNWAYVLFISLCAEYSWRYKKIHATSTLQIDLELRPKNLPDGYFTEPPQCMPDEYKDKCTVTAYRQYYLGEKMYMAKWKHDCSPTPEWAV
jgi:hypothetical protein